jgi:hypothetical protein
LQHVRTLSPLNFTSSIMRWKSSDPGENNQFPEQQRENPDQK